MSCLPLIWHLKYSKMNKKESFQKFDMAGVGVGKNPNLNC